MNRIQPRQADRELQTTPPVSLVEAGKYFAAREGAPCALFTPLHYEANYAYPLLVWLHGPGDDENQLKRLMPLISARNYSAVAPRGPCHVEAAARSKPAFTWGQSPADLAMAEQRVFDSIAQARKRFHVHPQRIFLAGFDAGGTMAFRLAMNHPDQFAGVLSLGGAFPRCPSPQGAPLRRLLEARQLRLFVACGSQSGDYSSEAVCDNLRLFHAAGMHVTLRQYACGQEITTAMLADMDRWIMEQILAPRK